MIILDTNVISALMQARPDPLVVAWLDAQPAESIWTNAVSIFEVRYGLHAMPPGRKQKALQDAFDLAIQQDLDNRVLDFDLPAANEAAKLAARLRATGRPVEIRDVQIAGIVAARRATLATRNTRHFADTGIPVVNPWPDESST